MKTEQKKQISILGAGKIGMALATLWLRAGHPICLGSRNPAKLRSTVDRLDMNISVKSLKEAAAASDIILIAVPYPAIETLVAEIKNEVGSKLIIDASNPFGFSPEGHVISTLGPHLTEGTRMANLLSQSHVVRAFTHILDELLVSRGTKQAGLFAIAIAGDDVTAKSIVASLVSDTGFVPVDIGTLAESAPLDPGGILFPQIFTPADMRLTLQKSKQKEK